MSSTRVCGSGLQDGGQTDRLLCVKPPGLRSCHAALGDAHRPQEVPRRPQTEPASDSCDEGSGHTWGAPLCEAEGAVSGTHTHTL